MDVGNTEIGKYGYPLPDERIAAHPEPERDSCRLLVSMPGGEVLHRRFSDLPELLPADAVLVRNNARVINARLVFHKETGARIEIFLLEPLSPADYALMFQSEGKCRWKALVGNSKKWKEGSLSMSLEAGGKEISLSARRCGEGEVELEWVPAGIPFSEIIEAAGKIPIPPYLNRESEQADSRDYQTVYARVQGSVAAPTAGLHFTPRLLAELESRGIPSREVSLHVGAGTFRPVKSATIGGHEMHTEHFSISHGELARLLGDIRAGRQIVAVGTTSVRTLESLPALARKIASGGELHVDQWEAYGDEPLPDAAEAIETILRHLDSTGSGMLTASTSIMIAPGFPWKVTGAMITNFHQPQSTLLLLVDSFLDRIPCAEPTWRRIYREALAEGYRFLSYGDATLLYPNKR